MTASAAITGRYQLVNMVIIIMIINIVVIIINVVRNNNNNNNNSGLQATHSSGLQSKSRQRTHRILARVAEFVAAR